ncbi:hypothetical protein DLAC_06883 [Tieghemostelium lacteum]|uniref:Calponin-homology (CH) domain-containing protein n=1 Tax=Tieghemostelium lacteum TaxID=361077 RepID=A0A151ZDL0_TIELA|nr:hypothetical protein DLAC_06883 [Tieghemostelium lacteum]|eukprot:KYQ92048.1 hypothetical protein DLAC_06883 [Tieghemostelium lacteum]
MNNYNILDNDLKLENSDQFLDELMESLKSDIGQLEKEITHYQSIPSESTTPSHLESISESTKEDEVETTNLKEIIKQFESELSLDLHKIDDNQQYHQLQPTTDTIIEKISQLSHKFNSEQKELHNQIQSQSNKCFKCTLQQQQQQMQSPIKQIGSSTTVMVNNSNLIEYSEWRSLIDNEVSELYSLVKELKLKIPTPYGGVDRPASPIIRSKTNHKELLLHNSTFTNILPLKNDGGTVNNSNSSGSGNTTTIIIQNEVATNVSDQMDSNESIQSRSAPTSPRKARDSSQASKMEPDPQPPQRSNSAEREKIRSPRSSSQLLHQAYDNSSSDNSDSESQKSPPSSNTSKLGTSNSFSSVSSIIETLKLPTSTSSPSLPLVTKSRSNSGGGQSATMGSPYKSPLANRTIKKLQNQHSTLPMSPNSSTSSLLSPGNTSPNSQNIIFSSPNKNTYYYKLTEIDQEKSEDDIKVWIQKQLANELCDLPPHLPNSSPLSHHLRSGVILCQLINSLRPNIIKKINLTPTPFHQLENIVNFLQACETVGVDKRFLFHSLDLYEIRNMKSVVSTIYNLARVTNKLDDLRNH